MPDRCRAGRSLEHSRLQRMLGHQFAAMTLDVFASPFEDDLDALSDRLDAAISQALADSRGLACPHG